MIRSDDRYVHMTSPDGRVSATQICPSDVAFRAFAGQYVQEIARCGVDMIMYDDDFRYGFIDIGMGCTCKNHLARMSKILNEEIAAEGLSEKLLAGSRNKYRSAWLLANGEFFRQFAREMRGKLDEVNPEVRFGPCSCMSLWDFDGVSTAEISRILAGNTKPFMRLIGAPYWSVNRSWGNRLQDVIELERMERSWCDDDIEIFGEGDVHPRPRFACPANYLEGFDTALRADGRMDGILKYVVDYSSGADYETGYMQRHLHNEPLYEQIERHFSGKMLCGVRVWETMCKFEDAEIPEEVAGTTDVQDMFFSPAARMMAGNSIPTIYKGVGVAGVAFGENVKYISGKALENGLILDAKAASILTERGVDVGITAIGERTSVFEEHFLKDDEYVPVTDARAYKMTLSDKAQLQSVFTMGNESIPASYLYENVNGQKFLVFTFNAYFAPETLFRQYTRSRQLADAITLFFSHPLPAYSFGNPDLYLLCKERAGALAVGLWNFFADSILKPEVMLDKVYKKITFINCTGELQGNRVILNELQPFAFAGFEVE
ncbi:MAG: hypothetical protein J6C37_02825 [Roseburia sp.]|nr:hypothetical protein [Roseburia sp.]